MPHEAEQSAEPAIGADVTDLFNSLTGYARPQTYRSLLVAPYGIRRGIVARIEAEVAHAAAGRAAASPALAAGGPRAGGTITESGVKNNLSVAVQYLTHWLWGQGAVALYNLMEDAATAEIARAQLYQWRHHRASLDDGRTITQDLLDGWLDEVFHGLDLSGPDAHNARQLVRDSFTSEPLWDFVTIPAYRLACEAEAASKLK